MTHEEFDNLVRRVEAGVGRRPAALARRVALLALVGYVGLLAWLLLVVLIAACFYAAMLVTDVEGKIVCGLAGTLVLFGGGYAALRALLVRVDRPTGRALSRAETPALFAVLDDLQARLRAAPFHEVLTVPDCNAAVVQVPRLGVLGWPRNVLLLGLPLLDGLAADEVRAVLAHEFAHLSREHGRFSHWLYRLRRSWEEVFRQLSRPRRQGELSLRPLVVRFVEWFWPRFNAYAFVLSRSHEYEADTQAARLTAPETIATALLRLRLLDRHLDDQLWPEIWRLANDQPEPPADALVRLREAMRAGPSDADRSRWLEEEGRVVTTNSDTHPCFRERLRAVGVPPQRVFDGLAITPAPTAAQALLGPALEAVRADVQELWRREAEPHWRDRHARAAALSHRLTALEQTVPNPERDADTLWDKALVLLNLRTDAAAEPLLRQVLALRPDHGLANLHLGRILLEAGQPEGVACLERLMAADEESVPTACALLREYHRRAGRTDVLRELDARLDRHEQALQASRAERCEVTARDRFLPHGLTPAELEPLRQALAAEPDLAYAELARKELRHFPKQRLFVLCAGRRPAWHRLPNRDRDQAMVSRLARSIRLPGRLLVVAPTGSFRALARKLHTVPTAEVYRRPL